jgi:hypothetical protein
MDVHRDFVLWAESHGVVLNGIAACRFPGRGGGIIAERKLEVCTFVHLAPWFRKGLFSASSSFPISLPCLYFCISRL